MLKFFQTGDLVDLVNVCIYFNLPMKAPRRWTAVENTHHLFIRPDTSGMGIC